MKNGIVAVACASPKVHIADPVRNADELIRLTKEADAHGAALILYPELSLTGYTCGDLFRNEKLISSARSEFKRYLEQTKNCNCVSVVGLPLENQNKLYDCAAVCQSGTVLGVVPKTNLTNNELRCFTSGNAVDQKIDLFGANVKFGTNMSFACSKPSDFKFTVKISQDVREPSNSDVSMICIPAALPQTAGSDVKQREKLRALGRENGCCYLYATCGEGESTTDYVFGGHRLICNGGEIPAEAEPFAFENQLLYSEINIDPTTRDQRHKDLRETVSTALTETEQTVDPHPFFPSDPLALENHCKSILKIQAHGLKQRLEKAYAKKAVIGISGGLDSTLALLVAAYAMDLLQRPRTDILAVTMPCFGTTDRTKSNATILCEELDVDFRCVNIGDAVNQHFRDIGHDPSVHDVTYENSQARERTQVLMDIANGCGGMVIGTGDLSELALGWATYNGDHMSMYGVNADVPKTLIRHIVAYCAQQAAANGSEKLAAALGDILDTPVSPELLPADDQGQIAQKTEDLVGPYELHDFYLYHLLKNGYSPEKLYRLAKKAFGAAYSDDVLLKWLEIFLRRFFNQQFKRSCLPDGPAVCEISLSPRGAWCMPSDASSAIWLEEVKALKETL